MAYAVHFRAWLAPQDGGGGRPDSTHGVALIPGVRVETRKARSLQVIRNPSGTTTILPKSRTSGLGSIRIRHPQGTFAPTPASFLSLSAICAHQELFSGIGIDWGSGTGCLAITVARIAAVRRVYALEIELANVKIARVNARMNAVQGKVSVLHSDSYRPFKKLAKQRLDSLKGTVDFTLGNPPSSEGDDGFGFRREVLRGAREYLKRGGLVFLSISSQYGSARIHRLLQDAPGYRYGGLLETTGLVPFDLSRADLLQCLRQYAAEEENGGLKYAFYHPRSPKTLLDAASALDLFQRTGRSPLMRWQVHLFKAR